MKKFIPLILSVSFLAGCAAGEQSSGKTGSGQTEQTAQETENGGQEVSAFAAEVEKNMFGEEPPEFLSEENQKLFEKAEFITYSTFVMAGFGVVPDQNRTTTDFEMSENFGYAYETDYMYSDLEDYIASVFTGEALENLKQNPGSYYETGDGRLCWVDAARGTNIFYVDKTFELISETDDKIEFKAIANYSGEYMYGSEEEFINSGAEGPYEWSEEYNFELVNTDDGWRVSKFEYWK